MTAQVVFFRFCMAVGICPLSGTTSAAHMAADLGATAVELAEEEVLAIEALLEQIAPVGGNSTCGVQ